jgi:hypothetical protein
MGRQRVATGAAFPEDVPAAIVKILTVRFGPLPPEILSALAAVTDRIRLDELLGWSARCTTLNEFRDRLTAQGT